jgi:peptidyl-prolyl cis-trans isomerase C
MKASAIVVFFAWSCAWAQLPPETVVVRIDGQPVTAAFLKAVMETNPPEARAGLMRDPKTFLDYIAFSQKLAALAEKAHLDQQSPVKETLEAQRIQTLASAEYAALQDSIPVSAQDQKKFYETHPERYTQARIKLLYVSFHDKPAPNAKSLTEPEAKAKIEKLLAQIRAGADFVKLVKENSEDSSAAKNGDYGAPIRQSEKLLPEPAMRAIFALKPGQVSDPVRTAAGYYLFRLEDLTTQPYQAVQSDIFMEIRQVRFEAEMNKIRKSDIKIEKPEFFTQAPPPSN